MKCISAEQRETPRMLSGISLPTFRLFTTADDHVRTASSTYAYGGANWPDLLTAYNGKSITYDAIGNPLSDGTWTYAWQHGRQLASMSKSGSSIAYA